MRWLSLYARSRQAPASAAVVLLVVLAGWAFDHDGPGPMGLGTAVLVLTVSVAAASVGLGGQDAALDRTAAIRWVPRRAAHLLLIGAFAAAALLALRLVGAEPASTGSVVRVAAGLAGLAGLGAVLCGAHLAWILPTGWLAVTVLSPAAPGTAGEVVHWMTFSPATTVSTGTGWVLLAVGTALYAVVGPRR
ncbi:hypothetical protein ACIQWA_39105 [Kitasatospora sp. NPDC098652]|uniref:hypothetical protein n=1 Tax=Kitasatospora sp. NPDC098652 TaxID=3364095 RepID=UPI00381916A7